jgi:hypothetical protein
VQPNRTAKQEFLAPNAMRDTCKYCAPLFFINAAATMGLADLPKADAFNGTLSFVRFEGKTYAITAYHVVEFLRRKAREVHGDGWLFSTLLGGKGNSVIERYIPSLPDTFTQPSPVYPEKAVDVALILVTDRFLQHIGKAAFPFERDADNSARVGFAVGYPTGEKADVVDEKGRRVGMNCVQAVAERVSNIQYFSEIPELPKVGSLSGMSGGPVFVPYQQEEISLAGIIREGSPFVFDDASGSYDLVAGLTDGPRVSFAVQPITAGLLQAWVAELGR